MIDFPLKGMAGGYIIWAAKISGWGEVNHLGLLFGGFNQTGGSSFWDALPMGFRYFFAIFRNKSRCFLLYYGRNETTKGQWT